MSLLTIRGMRALPRRTKASAVLAGSLSRRTYAQPAPNPPPLRSGSSSHDKAQSQSQWRSTPFATAQTLTLFSSSPEGLLIALRSTLQGMLDSAARVGPAPGAKPDGEGANHVLLYAVSKSLPPAVLGEAVSLLRGAPPSTTSESPKPAAASAAQIARMGVLSDSIPASLLPVEATGSEATPGEQLHSVALSLLPGSVAVPFRSTIPGRAQVQVGRWPAQKDSWRDTGSRVDMLEEKGEERGWEEVWGRENVARTIPAELQDVDSAQVRALLYFSDQAPQGLLEGLDAHFPDASSLGLTAPPTPFETGRPQTLLCARPNVAKSDANAGAAEAEDAILDKGAVGLALVAKEGTPAGIQVEYEGLKELGPRREITSARGNIISTLAGQNATQLFLRDIQARDAARRAGSAPSAASGSKRADDNASASATATATASEPSIEAMSRGLAREIASGVSKEEEFVVGVFDREQPGSEPLLLTQILSGHPSRGSLSLDTESELGPGPHRSMPKNSGLWVQFYERNQHSPISPIQIPGPDPRIWQLPRFLFLTSPSTMEGAPSSSSSSSSAAAAASAFASSSSSPSPQSSAQATGSKKAEAVMALPNLFVAASSKGWSARPGRSASSLPTSPTSSHAPPSTTQPAKQTKDANPATATATDTDAGLSLGNRNRNSAMCAVPAARATLVLRVQEGKKL